MRRITETGRSQLENRGVAGLSLREVARELGVVSSAVYRYVSSRDELLTLLLVDSFDSLADAVDSVDGAAAGRAADERLRTLADRVHRWARSHPEQWALIYGTPVRGYAAPPQHTTRPGTRVLARMAEIAADTGEAAVATGEGLGEDAREVLEQGARDLGSDAHAGQVVFATTMWSGIVGAVSADLFGQWGADLAPHSDELFAAQIEILAGLLAHGATDGAGPRA